MPDEMKVAVSRRIAASPAAIFAIVTDPAKQVEIDGSGMLVTAPDAQPMRAVGDKFVMDMDREPLGDIPLGKYTVENLVTDYVADRKFEWAPGGQGMPPFGHRYGYELTADGDATDVTLYCEWSGVPENFVAATTWPIVPAHMLEATLDRLDKLAAT